MQFASCGYFGGCYSTLATSVTQSNNWISTTVCYTSRIMRVLFLNPPFHPRFSREQRSPAVTKSGTLYYPKWLAHAAGVAIKSGHDVDLVHAPAAGYSVQAVIDRIAAKNIEAVVCDTSTPSILNDVSVIEALVAAKPSLHVLLVGRHVSSLPKETLAMSSSLEAVALREYEYTVRDWLEAKACGADLSAVDGLVWRAGKGEIVTNKPREAIKNLDELPFVSEVYKRFLHTRDYFYGHSLWPLVVFDTSRGWFSIPAAGARIIARSASIHKHLAGTPCATARWGMSPTSSISSPAKCPSSRPPCWK